MLQDQLRPPGMFDSTAPAYKDWLHVNVFDHATGVVGLVNTSLQGAPGDPRSRAVGTGLFDIPGHGWVGNVDVGAFHEAALGVEEIRLASVAVAVDPATSVVSAAVEMPGEGLSLSVRGTPVGPPIALAGPVAMGVGWLAWFAQPRLQVTGELLAHGSSISLSQTSGYFDHNWGRWHWGDVGWDWATFQGEKEGLSVVLSRVTDKTHTRLQQLSLDVRVGSRRRRFVGDSVSVEGVGVLDRRPRRLPGALAALHSDLALPRLPAMTRIRAHHADDIFELEFTGHNLAQLVLADPMQRGYSFVHQTPGKFESAGSISGHRFSGTGLGIIERAE